MRVATLDFSQASTLCPGGLVERLDSGIRTCGIQSSSVPVQFSTSGVVYNQVCGKVIAYQVGSPDAFGDFRRGDLTIDSNYVDGVSLTHGRSPRQHIWTFAAALDEYGAAMDGEATCECSHTTRGGRPSPIFVGQDYFCDAGLPRFSGSFHGQFLNTTPLWDGAGCGNNSTCCSFNCPP